MYITVMDFSTETITKLVWDVEEAESEQVEILLERMGYHLSQISYIRRHYDVQVIGNAFER